MSCRTLLFILFRRHSVSSCLGKNVCTIFVGSTTLSREGGVIKSASVGIWISDTNISSSLPVCVQVSSWAFSAFLPVYFRIIPLMSHWAGVCLLDGLGICLRRELGPNTGGIALACICMFPQAEV